MTIKSNVVAEYTSGSGVTIDGVLIKDNTVDGYGIAHAFTGAYNVLDYGAMADVVIVQDAVIGAGALSTLTSATAPFASGDVGKTVIVRDAGATALPLHTTISGYTSSTTVTLTDAASGAVSGVEAWFGTDDTDAFQDAIDAAQNYALGGVVTVPETANAYMISGTLTMRSGVRLCGTGGQGNLNTNPSYRPQARLMHDPTTPGDNMIELEAATGIGYVMGLGIERLVLSGTDNSGDCLSWIDPGNVMIDNCTIEYFVNGINIYGGIQTEIVKTMVRYCSNAGIMISPTTTTTTTIRKCYLSSNAWGAILDADASVNTTFQDTVFESCSDGALNVYEGNTATLLNCYVEDMPNPTGAKSIIKVGVDGTSGGGANDICAIYIIGGTYRGFNGVLPANSIFLECDKVYNALVIGADVRRVDKFIKTSANTIRVELFATTMLEVGATPYSEVNDMARILGNHYTSRSTNTNEKATLTTSIVDIYSSSSHRWGVTAEYGYTNPDLSFAVDDQLACRMDTNKRFYAIGGLGVGNSASATTLGSVTKKMQVFDHEGVSLGYVPIYDSIT